MDLLEKYTRDMTSPEDALLAELDRQTHLRAMNPQMISGHVQGKFLEMIVRMLRPQRILEIGTYTGYSALCMAAGLGSDGRIDTIEVDDEIEGLAASFFARSEHGFKIRHHVGSALDIAPRLGELYDLVFIDGDKRQYPDYYRMVMGDSGPCLVRGGSIILADNILWYGKVTDPAAHNDRHTRAIAEFNDTVRNDPRVENVIIPLRDGLNMIRVKHT